MLYLDNAATAPVRREVLEAMLPHLAHGFGNPSSHHTVGERAAGVLADARARVAGVLGVRAGDIVFTSGGTEANNLAVKGISLAALAHRERRHLITTAIEHESVLASADHLRRFHGFDVTSVPVDADGRVDPDAVLAAVRADTALVTLGYANNEIGTVQDVPSVASALAARGIPLHVDAVQAAGWLPIDRPTTGADALSLSGHKIGAPQGTGVLAVRGRIPLEPVLHGGGQERGRRSGTENVAGAVAIATALELAERERATDAARVGAARDALIAGVLDAVPGALLTGHPHHRLPGTASFVFPGTSGEAVLLELERRGIVSSSGSACAAGSDEPSHVLTAIGLDADVARTAVRITLPHGFTTAIPPIVDAVAASVTAVQSGA
ncbi:cysteine desulfurase family protein [Microbacterium aurantiacum]|uniref:Cysteine desulfurase n=1 Tax=Microbacterium aurantiacum TaxID=162393 RepID=A0A0M8MLF1_9MICO|nr:cysteine desulfurase family protein [Microbacterium chocolatum]ANG86046.1 cysteine desulfurase [Microbacterium chocolatum]KOS09844.1 cysteine desulfurase [Microbacterium chocolatum]